jgi:CRISPR/Cas system CSM-associated protein Csm3 (group 7 of RAMP superfamily)
MNPYDFVPVDWESSPERRPYSPHHVFNGFTGMIKCLMKAEVPVFLPDQQRGSPKQFLKNKNGEYIIPGSSLKGLFRNLVETIAPGCWLVYDEEYEKGSVNYQKNLPSAFYRCRDLEQLCPACRMFGVINGSRVIYRGKVGFNDARCLLAEPHDPIFTVILSTPKPHHRAWYLKNGKVAGRKFYFHQNAISTAPGWLPRNASPDRRQNQYIKPLNAGSIFEFTAYFENLDEEELSLLVYALFLENGMRHKIGYAKPAGLGTVHIQPAELFLYHPGDRYRHSAPATVFTGEELANLIAEKTARFVNDHTSLSLAGLRRIWAWPPQYDNYSYPSKGWFDNHPTEPIANT